MKIVVDAMGGDHAPLEIMTGALLAAAEYEVQIALCGDEAVLRRVAEENGLSLEGVELVHAPSVIEIEEDAVEAIKHKKDSSIVVGMNLLKSGGGDAFVSAGSTAAITVGATLIAKRIRGVSRAALATVMPTVAKPCMLLDCGANAICRPSMLAQFALMGSIYMSRVLQVEQPRVGLLNIGAEAEKGTELQTETYARLKAGDLNFVGNIEGRDVAYGACDVLVADGFNGNIVLKTTEGVASSVFSLMKEAFSANLRGKIAAALVMPGLKNMKKRMDYAEYGGAPLMGIASPVIKAHGSSKAKAIKNAVRQAIEYKKTGVIEEISARMAAEKEPAE